MRLLLDTCTFLWLAADDPHLTDTARDCCRDPRNEVFLSTLAAWEIAIKYRLGTSFIFNFMDRPSAFSDLERRILEASGTEIFVSAVSVWEMRLKYQSRYPSGDRKSRFAPENVLDALEPQNITFCR